jgi:hypothetical protein
LLPYVACGANLEDKPSSANYLPVDDDVKTAIEKVDKLIADEKWRDAIDICQKYLTDPPKTVLEIREGVYADPRQICRRKLDRLPERGRVLYRTLYDPKAKELYEKARHERSIPTARRLVGRFHLTSYGPRGVALLAELLFEKGSVAAAAARWTQWMQTKDAQGAVEAVRRRTAA